MQVDSTYATSASHMKALRRSDGRWVLVLRRGEPVVATVLGWVEREQIASGSLSGLGSIRDAELGYYDLDKREYLRRRWPGDMEVVNLTGNLARRDGQPVLHAHATLSGPDFAAVGGHLFEATVAVTLELEVRPGADAVRRAPDEETGLNLIHLP